MTDKFTFSLDYSSEECWGRVGRIQTRRGEIPTPVFMPVGTAGTVKTLSPDEVKTAGASIILGNTYHLMLRPGTGVLDHFGGLHRMMAGIARCSPIQVGFRFFVEKLNKINDEGVDSLRILTGALLADSRRIDADSALDRAEIMMVFDECCRIRPTKDGRAAMERSVAWAKRCRADHPHLRSGQALLASCRGRCICRCGSNRSKELKKSALKGWRSAVCR